MANFRQRGKKYKAHNAKSKCAFKIEECGEGEYYQHIVTGKQKQQIEKLKIRKNAK